MKARSAPRIDEAFAHEFLAFLDVSHQALPILEARSRTFVPPTKERIQQDIVGIMRSLAIALFQLVRGFHRFFGFFSGGSGCRSLTKRVVVIFAGRADFPFEPSCGDEDLGQVGQVAWRVLIGRAGGFAELGAGRGRIRASLFFFCLPFSWRFVTN